MPLYDAVCYTTGPNPMGKKKLEMLRCLPSPVLLEARQLFVQNFRCIGGYLTVTQKQHFGGPLPTV